MAAPATSPDVHRKRKQRLAIPASLALALTVAACASAYTAHGRHFPSLLTTPYLYYSIVALPSWEPLPWEASPVERYRLVAVNGEPLREKSTLGALRELSARLERIPVDQRVELTFRDSRGRSHSITPRVRSLGVEELLFFFVMYLLAAWGVLWSGGLLVVVGGRSPARRAYAFWSVVTFLFLLCFYDYHTHAWLAPLFSISTMGLLLGALWLAYAFPEPPRWRATAIRRVLVTLTLLGAGGALALAVDPFVEWDFLPIRLAIDVLLGPCIVALPVALLFRLRHGPRHDRTALRTASWGLLTTPLLIALTHVLSLFIWKDVRHLLLPFIVLLFPLSIGYAMIRNNILEARMVLTPRSLMVPLALGAIILSVMGTYLVYLLIRQANVVLVLSVLLGIAIFGLLMVLARRMQVRMFFPTTLAFRSTVEGLSDRLTSLREVPAIREAVEEVVAQTLPTLSARVLEPRAVEDVPHLPPGFREQLAAGENVWTAQSPREQHLLMPMRSLGELRAVLLVAPKREAALFTQEDLQLLETLAGLGALALHNAEVVQQLDSLRRLEVGAAQDEKRLALSALGTELIHEMVYPMNFLKDLLRRGNNGQPLDEEDLSFAREEIERMGRMIHSLRRLERPSPQIGSLQLLAPVQRALLLLRESIQQRSLSVSVDIPPETAVDAESDSLVQLLSNLLRNAAQAAPEGGAIGIRYRQDSEGHFIEVWDNGPGIPEEVARVLFTRSISTKEEGYGIGLTVVQRIARSFQWKVSFRREPERTSFLMTLPPR